MVAFRHRRHRRADRNNDTCALVPEDAGKLHGKLTVACVQVRVAQAARGHSNDNFMRLRRVEIYVGELERATPVVDDRSADAHETPRACSVS
jgi:hypothetical protein